MTVPMFTLEHLTVTLASLQLRLGIEIKIMAHNLWVSDFLNLPCKKIGHRRTLNQKKGPKLGQKSRKNTPSVRGDPIFYNFYLNMRIFLNINFSSRRIKCIDELNESWCVFPLGQSESCISIRHSLFESDSWSGEVPKHFYFDDFTRMRHFWWKIDDLENFWKTEDRLEGQTYFLSSQNAEKCRKLT